MDSVLLRHLLMSPFVYHLPVYTTLLDSVISYLCTSILCTLDCVAFVSIAMHHTSALSHYCHIASILHGNAWIALH